MSRCFAYPPPGYTTCDKASITLEKKRKKEEKKRSKEEKRERRKLDDDVIAEEVSGITVEEHGVPNYSSDRSTENSAKRKSKEGGEKRFRPNDSRGIEFQLSGDNYDQKKAAVDDACPISRRHREMREMAQQYRDVIENWHPPALSLFMEPDCGGDEDWLFGSGNPRTEKMASSSSTCAALWPPRAQFLPDANIYALPYVLPF